MCVPLRETAQPATAAILTAGSEPTFGRGGRDGVAFVSVPALIPRLQNFRQKRLHRSPCALLFVSSVQLNYALEDVTMLDEGLKQYMDGDGRRQSPSVGTLSWKRVSEAYLRPLVSGVLFGVVARICHLLLSSFVVFCWWWR